MEALTETLLTHASVIASARQCGADSVVIEDTRDWAFNKDFERKMFRKFSFLLQFLLAESRTGHLNLR